VDHVFIVVGPQGRSQTTGRSTSIVRPRLPLGAGPVGQTAADRARAAGLAVAVAGGLPIARLWHAVPCFPTISEAWLRLLEAYRG